MENNDCQTPTIVVDTVEAFKELIDIDASARDVPHQLYEELTYEFIASSDTNT